MDPPFEGSAEPINPYAAAETQVIGPVTFPLGPSFWGFSGMWFFLGIVLLFAIWPLGLWWLSAVILGTTRTVLYARRVSAAHRVDLAGRLACEQIAHLLTSLAIGIGTSLASLIAFVATCFPAGLFTLSIRPGGGNSETLGIIFAFGTGFVCAIGVAGLILRMSIPEVQQQVSPPTE